MQTIALILPTYNAASDLPAFLKALKEQTLQPDHFLVVDSSSSDNTVNILRDYGAIIHVIEKEKFNHGGTRRLATELIVADIYIVMTQDAILAEVDSLEKLIKALNSQDNIGAAFARQLPKKEATAISVHGRLMNYPEESITRYYADKVTYGIKTCFNSDNLAAYKRTALFAAGGFPENAITAEDAYVAAKMLTHGYGIRYAADATIFHSHNFSLLQEFHRYFSIGVFHHKESWIIKHFKSATKEGFRFVKSEILFLMKHKKNSLIPKALLSTIVKYFAYQLGKHQHIIPWQIKKNWGINKNYWLSHEK